MAISDPLLIANVITCTAIVVRLMAFLKPGAKHNWWASWLAYLLVLSYATVPFRFFFHCYGSPHWAAVAINLIICAAVFRSRGNVAQLLHVLRPQ